jgi:hypothetical protein
MVAGVVALMLEANPTLTPDTIRGLLCKYATVDTEIKEENKNVRGYGKVDAFTALVNINNRDDLPLAVHLIPTRDAGDVPSLFTIVPNPNSGSFRLHFSDADKGEMEVYSLNGTLQFRRPVAPDEELTLPNLPMGVYVIRLIINELRAAEKMVILK